jgi:hypothetical protein
MMIESLRKELRVVKFRRLFCQVLTMCIRTGMIIGLLLDNINTGIIIKVKDIIYMVIMLYNGMQIKLEIIKWKNRGMIIVSY